MEPTRHLPALKIVFVKALKLEGFLIAPVSFNFAAERNAASRNLPTLDVSSFLVQLHGNSKGNFSEGVLCFLFTVPVTKALTSLSVNDSQSGHHFGVESFITGHK